ncbi:MAG: zinc ABC transporter substrate-binding protein [Melioribacteraceae bacterium]|nr:zinc ABC transporter substrate-binding protein [Melioribacteraceae bacterium]
MQKIALIYLLLAALLFSCTDNQNQHNSGKLKAITTILPFKEFINMVGADLVETEVLIPPGADAHTYEPSPLKIKQLITSDIYFKVGAGFNFENNLLDDIDIVNGEIKITDCSEGIKIIDNNPHIWLSPREVKIILNNIYNSLAAILPEHKSFFGKNLERSIGKVDSIDSIIKGMFYSKSNRHFIVYHDAWKYFAEQYGLNVIVVEKDAKEPDLNRMSQVLNEARRYGLTTLFIDRQVSKEASIAIADELDAKIEMIEPLPDDFIANMIDVATKLSASMD